MSTSRDSLNCSSRLPILRDAKVMSPLPLGDNQLILANPNPESSFVHVPDIIWWYALLLDNFLKLLIVLVYLVNVF